MSASELQSLFLEVCAEKRASLTAAAAAQTPASVVTAVTNQIDETGYRYWVWEGKIRPVPQEWSMPKGNIKSVIDLFITGQPEDHVRPLWRIRGDMLHKKDMASFSKAYVVFKKIITIAEKQQYYNGNDLLQNLNSITVQQWDLLFNQAYEWIIKEVNSKRLNAVRNPSQLSYVTVYDMLLNELKM